MLEISSVSGEWTFVDRIKWNFVNDIRGGSFSMVDEDISFDQLVSVVFEDYGVDEASHSVRISYTLDQLADDFPPFYIRNDRQFKAFLHKSHEIGKLIQLCVTFQRKNSHSSNEIEASNFQGQNLMLHLGGTVACKDQQAQQGVASVASGVRGSDGSLDDNHGSEKVNAISVGEPTTLLRSSCSSSGILNSDEVEGVFFGKYYPTKHELMKKIRLHALRKNFEFRVRMSDKRRVVLGCVDKSCIWRFTAYRVDTSSEGFIVQHYASAHSCDTTYRNVNHRQATTKILGEMISKHYDGGNVGLKPKQIVEKLRKDHGINITYSKAYNALKYAEEITKDSSKRTG